MDENISCLGLFTLAYIRWYGCHIYKYYDSLKFLFKYLGKSSFSSFIKLTTNIPHLACPINPLSFKLLVYWEYLNSKLHKT